MPAASPTTSRFPDWSRDAAGLSPEHGRARERGRAGDERVEERPERAAAGRRQRDEADVHVLALREAPRVAERQQRAVGVDLEGVEGVARQREVVLDADPPAPARAPPRRDVRPRRSSPSTSRSRIAGCRPSSRETREASIRRSSISRPRRSRSAACCSCSDAARHACREAASCSARRSTRPASSPSPAQFALLKTLFDPGAGRDLRRLRRRLAAAHAADESVASRRDTPALVPTVYRTAAPIADAAVPLRRRGLSVAARRRTAAVAALLALGALAALALYRRARRPTNAGAPTRRAPLRPSPAARRRV